jgi:hypothetical protein
MRPVRFCTRLHDITLRGPDSRSLGGVRSIGHTEFID